MKKRITCPEKGTLCELTFEVSPESSRILGATKCSLIEGEVDCDQECVRLLNLHRDRNGSADSVNSTD
jgi:hypothetical protein